MDMIKFTHNENGMNDEYEKILRNEIDIILANCYPKIRIKQALNDRFNELHIRQDRYFEDIQRMMTEISLTERALHEIEENWNNKKYWNE